MNKETAIKVSKIIKNSNENIKQEISIEGLIYGTMLEMFTLVLDRIDEVEENIIGRK